MEVGVQQVQWEREESEEEELLMRRRRLPEKISPGHINDAINGDHIIQTITHEEEEQQQQKGKNSNCELSVPENGKSEDELSAIENDKSEDEFSDPENGKSNDELCVPEIGESNRERLFVPEIGESNRERIVLEIGESNRERIVPGNDNGQKSDNDKNGHVQSTLANDQYQQNSKDDILTNIKLLPTEKPVENPEITQSSSEITENGIDGDELKKEGLNDLDVERVFKEQNTHDLFCPNCNSCITRRVILRKRKRGPKISEEDDKHKKPEITDAISENITDNQSNTTVNTSTVDSSSQTPAADEYNLDTDPEVFRCLSCFTFFIPKGNGFKLFGDKKEKENSQSEQTLSVKKNWFSFLFASRKDEMLISKDVVANSDVESRPEISSSSSLLVVSSSAEGPQVSEEVVANGGEKTDGGQNEKAVPSHAETSEEKAKEESKKSQLNKKPKTTIGKKGTEYIDWLFPGKKLVHGESDNNKKVDVVADLPSQNGQNLEVKPSMPIHCTVQVQNMDVTYSDSSHSNGVAHNNNVGTKVDIHIEKTQIANADAYDPSLTTPLLLHDTGVSNIIKDLVGLPTSTGGDTIINIGTENLVQAISSLQAQDTVASTGTNFSSLAERDEERESRGVEVIKSIVYGGLVETVTSLGIVSSAAGSDTAIINIVALGLANLLSGLFVICHSLWGLKNDDYGLVSDQMTENTPTQRTQRIDKYRDLLGRRENFYLHAFVAILSYIIFGSLPPVVYGFSFQQSNDRYYKLITVAAASFLCIAVLSLGKAYVQKPPKPYVKIVFYYVALGFMASGVSYVAGDLIQKIIEKLGWLNPVADLSVPIMRKPPVQTGWSYY